MPASSRPVATVLRQEAPKPGSGTGDVGVSYASLYCILSFSERLAWLLLFVLTVKQPSSREANTARYNGYITHTQGKSLCGEVGSHSCGHWPA